jgi:hypothetical protein
MYDPDTLLPPLAIIEAKLTANARERRILLDLERLAVRAAKQAITPGQDEPPQKRRKAVPA